MYNSLNVGAQLTGYVFVTNGIANESVLTDALANIGPIDVSIYATNNFQFYKDGVYMDLARGNGNIEANHAINLVGYGSTLNGQDYYILRNSWGKNNYYK